MNNRFSMNEVEPEAFKAMMALENYTISTQVNPILKELIKIRASQINKCAYCLDMHTEDAIKLGESERRIYLLSAWKESHLFTNEEKIALQLTEEVTLIAANGVTEETYNKSISYFGEKTTAQLIMLVIVINAWNRICVSTHAMYKR